MSDKLNHPKSTKPNITVCSYNDLAATVRRLKREGKRVVRIDVRRGEYHLTTAPQVDPQSEKGELFDQRKETR